MDIQLINKELLSELHKKAILNKMHRTNFDLRTTSEDQSQRMLNAMEPGTHVPVHRHLKSSETVICLEGCLDWVFYEEFLRPVGSKRPEVERPNMDAGGPIHNGEIAADESCFKETARFRVCPREGQYGIQVPMGAWHSVIVHESSTILEAKDGKYVPLK